MDDQPLILVVNDEPGLARLFAGLCERENMRALQAGNGLEALKILETETPDLIFTDDVMPVMTGNELCRRIRESGRFAPYLPILLVTTRPNVYLDHPANLEGFNAFVTAPIMPRDYIAFIQYWMAWGRVQQVWHALPEAERKSYARAVLRDADELDHARVVALNLLVEAGLITDHAESIALLDTHVTLLQQRAVEHLTLFPLDVTRAPLRDLLHHAKPELRAAAIKVLNTYPDPDLPSLLVELIPNENSPSVMIAALRALEPVWDQYPVAFYVAIMARPYQSARYPDRHSDHSVDSLLERIFQQLPQAEVVDEVIAHLVQAEDADVRRRAIYPLMRLGSARAFDAVQQLAERDPDERVRERAANALKHLKIDKD